MPAPAFKPSEFFNHEWTRMGPSRRTGSSRDHEAETPLGWSFETLLAFGPLAFVIYPVCGPSSVGVGVRLGFVFRRVSAPSFTSRLIHP